MSTNWFARFNDEEVHVGHYAGGWAFHFHEVNLGEVVLDSWEKWKMFLQIKGVVISGDNCGGFKTFEEFVRYVENTAGRKTQAQWWQENPDAFRMGDHYVDPEGWDFSTSDSQDGW